MNNRVMWNKENNTYDPKQALTCFQKFPGEDFVILERRGLVLSKITKI